MTDLTPLITPLRRFAFSLAGNGDDADDMVQATLERMLSKPMPDDIEPLKWAFRVCRNLWVDDYRARKKRPTESLNDERSVDPGVDGDRVILNTITLKQVQAAMAGLNPDQHQVLSLVALQGLSYAEIAETLAIPVGTVMSRLARARKALGERLDLTHTGGALS